MTHKTVDRILEDAIARGLFKNLAGAGKPIDLGTYFDTPEHLRVAYTALKNAGFLPREVELLREIADIDEALYSAADERSRRQLKARAAELRLEWDERMTRLRRERG